jgi:hypothetical protein
VSLGASTTPRRCDGVSPTSSRLWWAYASSSICLLPTQPATTTAALATAAVMVWISVRVWMGIPSSGNATLDATRLMVLLTPSAATIGLVAVGAQLAKDTIEKLLPALGEPRHAS